MGGRGEGIIRRGGREGRRRIGVEERDIDVDGGSIKQSKEEEGGGGK